jgi:hypothetical protein
LKIIKLPNYLLFVTNKKITADRAKKAAVRVESETLTAAF